MKSRFEERLDNAINEGLVGLFGKKQTPAPQKSAQPPAAKPKANGFAGFLEQFAGSPYHIPMGDLQAVLRNPHDRAALDRVSNKDRHAYNMIYRYITSNGQDTGDDEEAEWGRGFWN